nr:AI-2E family transporter [Oscillatoria sp. FACHB-1406]
MGLIVLVVSLYILWQIRQLVLLFLTAVILAVALGFLVKKLQRFVPKRSQAVFLSLVLVFSIIIGVFWLIVPSFTDQFQQLATRIIESLQKLDTWFRQLEARLDPRFVQLIPAPNELAKQLQPLANRIFNQGWGFFFNTLGNLLNVLLVFILTLMILANPQPYRQGFIRLFPSFYRRRADEILDGCEDALQGWLVGVLFNMFVIGTLSFVGLLALRVPLALSQAILAAFFTLIPNIGPALSVVVPMAIGFLDAPWKPLAVLLLYFFIQQLETNVLTPLVMARQVSLLPAMTLLAQIFFASIFGFLGLFLALPLTVIAQVLISEILIVDVLDRCKGKEKSGQSLEGTIAEEKLLPATTEISDRIREVIRPPEPPFTTVETDDTPPSLREGYPDSEERA